MEPRDVPTCEAVIEAISALLDGEPPPVELSLVRAHVAVCASCAGFEAAASEIHRRTRVAVAGPVPDLAAAIVAAAPGAPAPDRRLRDLRVLVGLAGVAQVVIGTVLLAGGIGPGSHVAMDLAALELALGAGLIVAALQPHRAAGVLPVVAVVAAVAVITAVVDVALGGATLLGEATHLTEIVGVVALLALTRRLPADSAPRARPAV